jgi:NAD(P)-dependent dehydrogenase (short-subunit alcohol dehydrogenase family)
MSDPFAMGSGTDLTGKVAVITGAARDLGLALALSAADRGMMVALADANEHMLAAALEQVKTQGVEAIAVPIDVLDFAALSALARRTAAELGPPWLVCNNPGVSIEVTLWGVINGVQVFAPGMAERDAGHIVNIAAAEMFGDHCAAVDAAITHAIVGLSESLYRELDSMGSRVGVTLVCPALGNTNIAGASEYQNSDLPSTRCVALNSLPPEEMAEQIFAAVVARHFWFSAHPPGRASRARTDSTAKSQRQQARKRSGAARTADGHYPLRVTRHVTHSWKSQ